MTTVTRVWGLILLAGLAATCGGTGQQRVTLDLFARGSGGDTAFTNEKGWTVSLDEVRIAVGPIYFFAGEPLFGELLRLLSPISVAWAHPGHYVEGEAMGEWRGQVSADLLAGEAVSLGPINGVTGDWNSAQITFDTPEVGHAIEATGTASLDDQQVSFEAQIDLDVVLEGVPCGVSVDESGGRLLLEVDLQRWFAKVDFASLEASGSDAVVPITIDSQAYNALTRGVNNGAAYAFSWLGEQEETKP